ncbi:hypothetical protein ACJX0J_020196, partial [Zea mays]
ILIIQESTDPSLYLGPAFWGVKGWSSEEPNKKKAGLATTLLQGVTIRDQSTHVALQRLFGHIFNDIFLQGQGFIRYLKPCILNFNVPYYNDYTYRKDL